MGNDGGAPARLVRISASAWQVAQALSVQSGTGDDGAAPGDRPGSDSAARHGLSVAGIASEDGPTDTFWDGVRRILPPLPQLRSGAADATSVLGAGSGVDDAEARDVAMNHISQVTAELAHHAWFGRHADVIVRTDTNDSVELEKILREDVAEADD